MVQESQNQSLMRALTRIVAGGCAAIVVMLGGLILHQDSILTDYDQMLSSMVKNELKVQELRHQFKVQVQEWKNVLLRGHNAQDREKYWSRFQKHQESIQTAGRSLLPALDGFPEARQLLQSFINSHAALFDQYQRGYDAYVNSGYDPRVGDSMVRGIDRAPTDTLSELLSTVEQILDTNAENLASQADTDMYMLTPLSILGAILITIGLVWFLRANVTAPLEDLLGAVADFSHGDFSRDVTATGRGEVQALNQSLQAMQANMRRIIAQLKDNTGVLKQTSDAFSGNVRQVTQQFHDVQSRADMVATATQEMSAASQEISRNAQNAADASNAADNSAKQGIKVMTQTIDSINRLSHEVEQVTQMMNQLEESTNSIGSVLDVIKGIAEQTNLLALNAAIEAARAGEQGRGFAVVADEVRTLAQRTQESTEEIHRIIDTVQNGASNAVSAMRKGRDQTRECVKLAESAGVSIHEITDAVESIKSMNTQIAAAAEEQTTVSEDISENITGVASLSSETQRTVQENSRFAGDLDKMAGSLADITSQFRI
ncbi:MAG: methyl-accepting chemotaxis protein [Ketobacteraceae bacterium]|nr:methyl-accepting chemotaxis protein [Ketobacteraceae bacterium]